jgi:hypothetical protein
MELMLELHRRGYLLAAAAGNCGRPTGQYDVALGDWRRRTLHALETTMDWLVNFLSPCAALVMRTQPQFSTPQSDGLGSNEPSARSSSDDSNSANLWMRVSHITFVSSCSSPTGSRHFRS